MKTLVVFYSRTGTTKKIAEAIAHRLSADIEQIIDTKNRKGIIGYLRCGREAMRKSFAEIKEIKNRISDYDLVVIGTPIWGWNMSSPVRAFLNLHKNELKNVAFFCSMGGSGGEKTFSEMGNIIGKNAVAALAMKEKEVLSGLIDEPLNSFVQKIKK